MTLPGTFHMSSILSNRRISSPNTWYRTYRLIEVDNTAALIQRTDFFECLLGPIVFVQTLPYVTECCSLLFQFFDFCNRRFNVGTIFLFSFQWLRFVRRCCYAYRPDRSLWLSLIPVRPLPHHPHRTTSCRGHRVSIRSALMEPCETRKRIVHTGVGSFYPKRCNV